MERFGVSSPGRVRAVRNSRLMERGPEEAFDRLTRLASTILRTQIVALTIVDDSRSWLKGQPVPGAFCAVGGQFEWAVEEVACQVVVDSGAEVCVQDVSDDPRLRDLPQIREFGIGAWLGIPITDVEGYVLGNLCAMETAARVWTVDEVETMRTLATAAGGEIALRQALERSELLATQTAELASTLEHSLVPGVLPDVPGLEIASEFRAGGTGVTVLGDFYDVFPGRHGVHVLVGDVSGHGAPAARATAMARSSMRTAAHLVDDPRTTLEVVNEVLRGWFDGRAEFVTAVHAHLLRRAPDAWTAGVAGAGHPPGLVRRRDGAVEHLHGGGTILGILPEAGIGHQDLDLGPGDCLVLFTDGVTEAHRPGSRDQFDDEGVVAALSTLPVDAPAAGVAATVVAAATTHAAGELADDAGIVVVRIPTLDDRAAGPRPV